MTPTETKLVFVDGHWRRIVPDPPTRPAERFEDTSQTTPAQIEYRSGQ